jgi:hypothetical protein
VARAIKTITVLTAPFTNITGFVPFEGLDFAEEIQIWRGAAHMVTGPQPSQHIDVIPGNDPSQGDIQFTNEQPPLQPGELIVMQTYTLYQTALVNPKYDPVTQTFTAYVWAESHGRIIAAPDQASLAIRAGTAPAIHTFPLNTSPTVDGVFTFTVTIDLPRQELYICDVTVTVNGNTITTKRGFNLG